MDWIPIPVLKMALLTGTTNDESVDYLDELITYSCMENKDDIKDKFSLAALTLIEIWDNFKGHGKEYDSLLGHDTKAGDDSNDSPVCHS